MSNIALAIERPSRPGSMPRRQQGGVEMLGVKVEWHILNTSGVSAVEFFVQATRGPVPESAIGTLLSVSPFLYYTPIPFPSFLSIRFWYDDRTESEWMDTDINLVHYLRIPAEPEQATPEPTPALPAPRPCFWQRLLNWVKGLFQ